MGGDPRIRPKVAEKKKYIAEMTLSFFRFWFRAQEKKPHADERRQGLGLLRGEKPFADEGGQGLGAPPRRKKTVCRRRGSGFRGPPGGKKPFADEGCQGLGPRTKPHADEAH